MATPPLRLAGLPAAYWSCVGVSLGQRQCGTTHSVEDAAEDPDDDGRGRDDGVEDGEEAEQRNDGGDVLERVAVRALGTVELLRSVSAASEVGPGRRRVG